jgi:hypothetical protein
MFKTMIASAALLALAGAAEAQQPLFAPTVDGLCASPPATITVIQQQTWRLVCASPRLKAGGQRNMTAALAFLSKVPAGVRAELIARMTARQAEHIAYCRVADNPQTPPSPAMEACLAYWQDFTMAEIQRGEALVAQAQTQQAISGFFANLGNALGNYADQVRRNQPVYQPAPGYLGPQYCMTQGGHGSWTTSCQ